MSSQKPEAQVKAKACIHGRKFARELCHRCILGGGEGGQIYHGRLWGGSMQWFEQNPLHLHYCHHTYCITFSNLQAVSCLNILSHVLEELFGIRSCWDMLIIWYMILVMLDGTFVLWMPLYA